MKNLFIIVLLAISISVFGQTQYIGTKLGINYSNAIFIQQDNSANSYTSDFLSSFSAGITYDYAFASKITLGVDLMYQQYGFMNATKSQNQGLYYGDRLDCISAPIKIGFITGEKFVFQGNTGLIPMYAWKSTFFSHLEKNDTEPYGILDMTESTKDFFLNVFIELSLGYRIQDDVVFKLSTMYQQGLISREHLDSKIYYYSIFPSLGVLLEI